MKDMAIPKEAISSDLKQAMCQKDKLKVSVLRMLLAALKNKEIALGKNIEGNLTDEEVSGLIKSEIKKRKETIEIYKKRGGKDKI